jgi:hypothetical protein
MIYAIARLNIKDRASLLRRKGYEGQERYHKSSIFNIQYSIPACPGWVLARAKEPCQYWPEMFAGKKEEFLLTNELYHLILRSFK